MLPKHFLVLTRICYVTLNLKWKKKKYLEKKFATANNKLNENASTAAISWSFSTFFGCFENSASDKQKRKRILMFDSYAWNAQKVPFEFTDWISLKIFSRSCSQLRKMWFHSTIFYIMWKIRIFCALWYFSLKVWELT